MCLHSVKILANLKVFRPNTYAKNVNIRTGVEQGLEECEAVCIIVDDSDDVWRHHAHNLLHVERYTYFPSSRRQLNLRGPSFLEAHKWVPAPCTLLMYHSCQICTPLGGQGALTAAGLLTNIRSTCVSR